jgi:hypothetical protein
MLGCHFACIATVVALMTLSRASQELIVAVELMRNKPYEELNLGASNYLLPAQEIGSSMHLMLAIYLATQPAGETVHIHAHIFFENGDASRSN